MWINCFKWHTGSGVLCAYMLLFSYLSPIYLFLLAKTALKLLIFNFQKGGKMACPFSPPLLSLLSWPGTKDPGSRIQPPKQLRSGGKGRPGDGWDMHVHLCMTPHSPWIKETLSVQNLCAALGTRSVWARLVLVSFRKREKLLIIKWNNYLIFSF